MLQSLVLQRFKSVYDRTELPMGMLTIFAGVNNSGKSTVIQSILLAAQTLQMPLKERPIALNGHIIRLGTFDDIVSNGHETEAIHIGFTLGRFQDRDNRSPVGQRRLMGTRASRRILDNIQSLSFEFSFSSQGESRQKEILQLQPTLEACRLTVDLGPEKLSPNDIFSIRRRRGDIKEFAEKLKLTDVTVQDLRALEYEVIDPQPLDPKMFSYNISGRTVGASLNHFIPRFLLIVYDAIEQHVTQVVRALTVASELFGDELEPQDFESLPAEFMQLVLEVCEQVAAKAADSALYARERIEEALLELRGNLTQENYRRFLGRLSRADRTLTLQLLAERQPELIAIVRQNRPPEYRTRYHHIPEPLDFAAEYLGSYFQDYVKYLAPLRDEPKPVYPLFGSTDPMDVGFRGEHTAAVLDLNQNRSVEYISSQEFVTAGREQSVKWSLLREAVLDWLEYMGVVSDVVTTDRGKLGHELKVSANNNKCLRDLTHVGVGVSQVLPIVVSALLAARGSTLIFEQPELHLHPRVQSRLADFFISMTFLGKQCVVETHSEHLINKLRQQVASSNRADLAPSIVMYFVEANDGRSTYTPVEITQSGSIRNWPKGFFDESEELAAGILKAALVKRSRARETR